MFNHLNEKKIYIFFQVLDKNEDSEFFDYLRNMGFKVSYVTRSNRMFGWLKKRIIGNCFFFELYCGTYVNMLEYLCIFLYNTKHYPGIKFLGIVIGQSFYTTSFIKKLIDYYSDRKNMNRCGKDHLHMIQANSILSLSFFYLLKSETNRLNFHGFRRLIFNKKKPFFY